MALRVHHAHARAEAAGVSLIEAGERSARIAKDVVEVIAQRIVEQPHPRINILAETRRLPEMLAKDQRIVAGHLAVEIGVALVRVAEGMGEIELQLRIAGVAVEALVAVRAGLPAEEPGRGMLHRI